MNVLTPLVNKEFYDLVMDNAEEIESVIDYQRDSMILISLVLKHLKSYLYRVNKNRLKDKMMTMRVALSIHRNDLSKAFETYNLMACIILHMTTYSLQRWVQ